MAPDINTLNEVSPSAPNTLPSTINMSQTDIPMPQKQPNILYIMADQLAAPLLKMHNPNSQILTPNLDKLASNGVVFDSA